MLIRINKKRRLIFWLQWGLGFLGLLLAGCWDGPVDLRGRVVSGGGGPGRPGEIVASAGGGKPAGPTEVGTVRGAGGPAAGPEGPVRTAEPPVERPGTPTPLPEGLAADLLPSLSEDMRAVRAGLSLEDQARFDAKMRRIAGRDPWNPSHEQALRAYVEGLKKKGTVSEGLRNDSSLEPDKQGSLPRPPRAPFGDPAAVAELANLRRDAALLRQDIQAKQASFQPKGLDVLKNRINEVFSDDFVKMERGEEAAKRNQTDGARGNLKGIQAEWERAQQGHEAGTRVVEVSRKIKVFIDGIEYDVDIDIIEQGGHRWVEVKFGEPPPEGSPGATKLLKQIDDRLAVSKDPRFYVEGRPPEVAVSFGSGEVSPGLRASLEQRGVKIEIRSQGVLP